METGIFISRDSYAGKVWDILSQNRYTYAENNPVTFADPSGHAKLGKSIGSTIGSKVAGGLSNLKTSLVPAVNKKNTNVPLSVGYSPGTGITTSNVSLSVGATHGTGLVSTPNKLPSLLDNIRTYNGKEYYNDLIARVPVRALMSPAGGMTYAESVAAQIEVKRCATYGYCENTVQEIIKGNVDLDTMPIYGKAADDKNRLSAQEQLANAQYIYCYLIEKGWTTEAICGLLGNIHRESHHNPGTWQKMNDTQQGYGLVQWTWAEKKFLSWMSDKMGIQEDENHEKVKTLVNGLAENSADELMNYELEYFLESIQPGEGEWIPTTDHKSPEKVELKDYISIEVQDGEDPEKKMDYMALVFQGTYECSQDENDETALQERCEWANRWYKHFKGVEDIQPYLEEEERIYGR